MNTPAVTLKKAKSTLRRVKQNEVKRAAMAENPTKGDVTAALEQVQSVVVSNKVLPAVGAVGTKFDSKAKEAVVKRAKNAQHNKPVSGGRRDADDMSRREAGKPTPPPSRDVSVDPTRGEDVNVQAKPRSKVCIVKQDEYDFTVARGTFYKFARHGDTEVAIDQNSGMVFPVVYPGMVVDIQDQGPGFIVQHNPRSEKEKKGTVVVRDWVVTHKLPRCGEYPPHEYTVAQSVLAVVHQEIHVRPSAPSRNMDVAIKTLLVRFPNVPRELLRDTLGYHIHLSAKAHQEGVNPGWDKNDEYVSPAMRYGSSVIHQDAIVRIGSEDVDAVIDWFVKPWIRVKKGGVLLEDPRELLRVDLFDNFVSQDYYRSQYWRLRGVNDFKLNAINGHNFMHGLKRLWACREDPSGMLDPVEFETTMYTWQLNVYELLRKANPRTVEGQELIECADGNSTHGWFISTPSTLPFVKPPRIMACLHGVSKWDVCRVILRYLSEVRENLNNHGLFDIAHDKTWNLFFHDTTESVVKQGDVVIDKIMDCGYAAAEWFGLFGKSEYRHLWDMKTHKFQDEEHRRAVSLVKHKKQALRAAIHIQKWWTKRVRDYHRHIVPTVKKESAKPGKVRLFANYGDGSMMCPELPEFIKLAMYGVTRRTCPNGLMIDTFAVTVCNFATLKATFCMLWESRYASVPYVFGAIYSDDSVYGTSCGSGSWFNVDVKSKDSSAMHLEFAMLHNLLCELDVDMATELVEQCRLPFKFKQVDGVVEFTSTHPVEGSGTSLTTVLNHLEDALGVQMLELYSEEVVRCGLSEALLVKAANLLGHVVSVDVCEHFQQVQFVKRSPVLIDSVWVPMTNLGCIIRNLGTIEGDLTHLQIGLELSEFRHMSVRQRGDVLVGCQLEGWKLEPRCTVMDALHERFGRPGSKVIRESLYEYDCEASGVVPDEQMELRYPGWMDGASYLAHLVCESDVFDEVTHPLVSTIMLVDYGLPVVNPMN